MTMKVLAAPLNLGRENVAANAATSQLVNTATTLAKVIITAAGSAVVTFYDNLDGNTSGDKVAALPATTTIGQVFDFNSPCFLGLSASGGAGCPEYVVVHTPSQTN